MIGMAEFCCLLDCVEKALVVKLCHLEGDGGHFLYKRWVMVIRGRWWKSSGGHIKPLDLVEMVSDNVLEGGIREIL